MILPSRRWLRVAASLGALGIAGYRWPAAATLLIIADVIWIILLIIDARLAHRVAWRDVDVRRVAPPAFSMGRDFPVSYEWSSRATRPLHLLVREEYPARVAPASGEDRAIAIVPGESTREELVFHARARGKASGGTLHLRARSPWGLAWRQGRIEAPWKVTVYPSLASVALRAFPTQAQRRREAGYRNVRRLGEGRVFESLKEWVPGDDTRTIDWKATARRGKVMSRQYEDERRQQVLIVVDAGRALTPEWEGRSRLEAVIDAALQLANAAVSHDDNIGILVFSDKIQHYVPPARGRRALRNVLDALAATEGKVVEPDYPAAFAFLAAHNRKRALTVLFTDVIDRTASDALLAQSGSLRPRHLPLAVTVRDPHLEQIATARPTTAKLAFERAAAEELLLARQEALADMRSRGVIVLDVPPASAAKAVVDQYNWLKRRAVL